MEVVIIKKKDYEHLQMKMAEEIYDELKKGWGYKLISRETGKEVVEFTQLLGFLIGPMSKVLDEHRKKEV